MLEAVTEDLDVKRRLFSELDEICPARAIFATNTSAIPITEIAATTPRAHKVVGTHFFSPVPLMRVVEIMAGLLTSADTMKSAENLAASLGKETLRVNRGVALNALNVVYEETRDEKFRPPMLLQRKVRSGHLGRKNGRGWYEYDRQGNKIGPADC